MLQFVTSSLGPSDPPSEFHTREDVHTGQNTFAYGDDTLEAVGEWSQNIVSGFIRASGGRSRWAELSDGCF
jgi:hypothetical protein